jgi:hypothetical protein
VPPSGWHGAGDSAQSLMIVYKLLHYLMIAEKHFVYIKLRWRCQAIIKPLPVP